MLVKSEAFSLLIHHHRLRTNSTSTTACELCLQCRGCILILTSTVLSELDLGDVRTRIFLLVLDNGTDDCTARVGFGVGARHFAGGDARRGARRRW
jgi:hypothetical protein